MKPNRDDEILVLERRVASLCPSSGSQGARDSCCKRSIPMMCINDKKRKWRGANDGTTLFLLALLALVTINPASAKHTEDEYSKRDGSERDAKLALQKSEAKHRVKGAMLQNLQRSEAEHNLQLDAIRSLPSSLMSQITQYWYGAKQCVTHDRSGTCSQGLQQHINLGAGSTWSTNDAAGDDQSPGNDFNGVSCANAGNCNPAKCAGGWQDNTALHGDMNCEDGSFNNDHKGNKCLDNLSAGAFFTMVLTCVSCFHIMAIWHSLLVGSIPSIVDMDGVCFSF